MITQRDGDKESERRAATGTTAEESHSRHVRRQPGAKGTRGAIPSARGARRAPPVPAGVTAVLTRARACARTCVGAREEAGRGVLLLGGGVAYTGVLTL